MRFLQKRLYATPMNLLCVWIGLTIGALLVGWHRPEYHIGTVIVSQAVAVIVVAVNGWRNASNPGDLFVTCARCDHTAPLPIVDGHLSLDALRTWRFFSGVGWVCPNHVGVPR